MERAIEIFAVLNFGVVGASHVIQHRAWAEFFVWLAGLGRPGVFLDAGLSFLIGTLIVSFHDVWTGLPTILTVLGWGMTAKGALYLCAPGIGARALRSVSVERSRRFIPAGVLLLIVAGVLGFSLSRS